MPYWRIRQTWQITMKTPHTVHLLLKEGWFRDTILLYVDDRLVLETRVFVTSRQFKGKMPFEIDGRILELRWHWSIWSGNPTSIVIMYKDRVLAQYGDDRTAHDDLFLSSGE
ncbi:MAG: hypothetical protein ACPG7F_07160 [Aggregatilineales bacterium]